MSNYYYNNNFYYCHSLWFSLEVHGLPVLKYFYFVAPNTQCALVVALSEKIKYHSVWLMQVFSQTLMLGNSKNENKTKKTQKNVSVACVWKEVKRQ